MAKAKRKEKKLRPMTTTELETLLRSSFATLTQDLNCIGGTASAANRKDLPACGCETHGP